jgi:hypothetical protein
MNVILTALIILFFIGAVVPGYQGFAISMRTAGAGSTEDADFWYIIQSSIMAILGNLMIVAPLLRKPWFSGIYSTMWIFFGLGCAFNALAIINYPFLNAGWSSMFAFFGSVASTASVLIITQSTGKEIGQAKVKKD